jgi:hypothetical protein
MMSSVIPARLEFQCGHAALVSLPKIKNESAARRNERVAQEKVDARGRRCDFCGPLVTELVATPLPTNGSNGSNGTDGHHATPPKPVAQVSIVAVAPVEPAPTPVVVVRTPHPSPLPEGEGVATKPVAAPKPVVAARRAVRRRTNGHSALSATGKRYTVRFKVEQIVQATDLRDALRQVNSLGAVEVLAITAR